MVVPEFAYDVVIPTHGRAPDLLGQTLTSVLGQTVAPRRVIVVVDGAPRAAEELRGRWPEVEFVLLETQQGQGVARQAGIEAATSEWVAFVDDDDLWSPRKMHVTADFIAVHPHCAAVRTAYWVFEDPDRPAGQFAGQPVDFRAGSLSELEEAAAESPSPSNDPGYLDIRGESLNEMLARNAGVMGSTCVRRAVLDALPPVPAGIVPGDDYLLFCLVATRTEWWLIHEPLLYYRLHPGQDTRQHREDGALAIVRARRVAWELCGDRASRSLETYGPSYRAEFRTLLWPLLRERRWAEARRTHRAMLPLLPRVRDRLALLLPEPVAWRWRRRTNARVLPARDIPASPQLWDVANAQVAVVIATYNRPDHVRECLEHLARQTVQPAHVVVVDASPDDRTRHVVADYSWVEYRRNDLGRGHTASSRAIGIRDLDADVVAFLDDDAYAEPTWLAEILAPYRDLDVAAVGGRALNGQPDEADIGLGEIGLLLPDGTLTGWFAADPDHEVAVDHMLGANMSVRLDVVRALGGIRDFYPGTCLREETDIALRMRRAGFSIVYTPRAVVRHVAGTYAKGRRFDSRYRYFGARNHVVLLATTLGWGDPHVRRYVRTAAAGWVHEVRAGLVAARDRDGVTERARGLAGGLRRATIDALGTVAGVGAALVATAVLRRGGTGVAA